ncbi:hypothetical protein [Ructibacterium gallinarum]|uniref:Uncharacterized protein n=1 Tax=Ructibacterium gallinarum TaxID=2779355 RepID=A0A9D5M5P9_9FIRM|nr:hypothetical protein [Ructibacterium gallinarum]MBE5039947.1 hypothetical protein [Ructibacterium gallinarum]
MRKIILSALICCAVMVQLTCFAQAPEQLVTEAYVYTGTLYYCDAARNKIVLKNVQPVGSIDEKNTATAAEAEYNEIWVSGGGTLGDGSLVPMEDLNRYADSNVRVIITRSAAEGIRVVTLKFL